MGICDFKRYSSRALFSMVLKEVMLTARNFAIIAGVWYYLLVRKSFKTIYTHANVFR